MHSRKYLQVDFLEYLKSQSVSVPHIAWSPFEKSLKVSIMFASIVLFLVGSSWWLELGGLDNNQLHYLNATITNNSKVETTSTEFLQSHSLRLKVDIPDSQQAPPLAAVTPLLNILSSMGFSVLSHNDEYRPTKDMVYLTWILQKERDIE